MYEVFDHTADLGLRMRAPSLSELFAEAGRGLAAVLVANLEAVRLTTRIEIVVPGVLDEPDLLLFDWLNELLFRFETDRLVLREFEVRFTPAGLTATAAGEPLDHARHDPDHEVKAITYHGLRVEQVDDGWLAEVIVDI